VACGLAKADAWVSPTAAFRNEISAIYRPRRPGRVIHNGLTVASARVAPKRSIILAAGRLWDEAKNLRAVTSIAPGLPWQVQVAGSLQAPNGASTPQVREVCYLGELPNHDLIKWMRQASIFVAPSLYEPFGLTVLEAAACGCALVLADLPGFRELWDQAALFADPRDHQALRAAVQALCDDESLRRRLQASARARAKRYSRGAMRDAYRRLYGELTMGCRAPAAATEPRLMEARA
jgi:glycosyltransferase involved in cell wall biosynthesis